MRTDHADDARTQGLDEVGAMTDIWSQTLAQLRIVTKRAVVDSWFAKIALVRQTDLAVHLGVPDEAFRDYVSVHFLDSIRRTLQAVASRPLDVHLVVVPGLTAHAAPLPYDARTLAAMALPDAVEPRAQPHNRRASDRARAAVGQGRGAAASVQGGLPLAFGADELVYSHEIAGEGLDGTHTAGDNTAGDAWSARFTFESFTVGLSNQLAASAARSVAETPGTVFNPLFVHGGVGLGKTHLLHAIGRAARMRTPGLRVRYVATETFIEDNHAVWRSKGDPGARASLRQHYRDDVDLLLVDDIQFLQKQTQVQEEFFHLFNTLHLAGKQIVLTCDRYPSELQAFHDRLRSRFDWGLVAEMQPPERDLRMAILRQKAAEARMAVPHDVVLYLADHLRNNVRELEGALNKLAAHSQIGQRPIDLALARSVLGPMIELPSRHVTVEVIQRQAAQHFSLKIPDLKGAKRHRSVVLPRMIAVYLTRKHTQMSYPDIGKAFGGRDHSTIIHACQKIDWLLTTDPAVQAALAAIETALGK